MRRHLFISSVSAASALVALLLGCSSREKPTAPLVLQEADIQVPSTTPIVLTLAAPSRGHRLVEISQEGADVRLEVMDTTGVWRVFDAPARRAAGPERACWFDEAGPFTLRISTEDRVQDPARRLHARVVALAARSENAISPETAAECAEAQGALIRKGDAAEEVNVRRAAYEDAARRWSALGQRKRAAAALLNAAWLVARELRETPNWTMAVRLGKAARAEFDAVQDASGVARASLQLAVPRGELGRRGLGDKGEPSPRKKSLELIGTELTAAVATFDAAGDRYFSALARNSLGSNYYYRGDFARALPMLEDAADRFRDAGEGGGTVMALGNFNVVVRSTGSYAEAAAAFDRLLGDSLDVAAKQTLADILNNSAATQLAAGKYDKALLQFMQALATHDESNDQGGIARSMIGVADTYLHLGYATAARDYATRGRARALGGEDEIASLLIEGDAQRALGDNPSAADSHARAYELASNPDIESDALRARSALELVQDAMDVGNGAAARQWIADAAKYVKPERRLLELEFKLRQSQVKIAAGETQEAFAELSALRGRFEALGAPAYEVEVLHELARAQRALGRASDALVTNGQCLERFARLRLSVTNPELRARLTAARRDAFELRVALLLAERRPLVENQARSRLLQLAMEASDAAQSGLVGAVISARDFVAPAANADATADPHIDARRELLGGIAMRERALSALEFGASAPADFDRMRADLARLRTRYDALDVRRVANDESRFPDVRPGSLRPDTAVLVFLHAGDVIHRVVITRTGIEEQTLAKPEDIEKAVQEANARLRDVNVGAQDPATAAALEQLERLLLDGTDSIGGKQRWIVVTDSTTATAPFAALRTGPQGREPLIARHDLSMALTVRDALALAQAKDRALRANLRQVAIIYDPVFTPLDERVQQETRTGNGFAVVARLAGTVTEKEQIVKVLPKESKILAIGGFDATRERVLKDDVRSSNVLHFATHAIASDQWPYGSGLLLTGSEKNGTPLNGYLSTLDLLWNRSAADLVVLSACDSAAGESSGSENVAGLARAVLGGGARRVVAARWPVDDDATATLMSAFYKSQADGNSTARALSRAQAAMLSDRRGARVWAAFVLYERAPPAD